MGLFSSKSSTSVSSTTQVTDLRAGAEGSGSAISQPQFEGNLIVGSDNVASLAIQSSNSSAEDAIQSSKDALTISTDFLSNTLSGILESADRSQERAQGNITASRDFAAGLVKKEQEGSDDRLIGLLKIGLLAGVSIVALKSGVFKDLVRIVK